MDQLLARIVDADTPKLNRDLVHGLAHKAMADAEDYIESVFREVARGFPPNLKFIKGTRCSPQEMFNETTRWGSKLVYDVAKSDLFMVKYSFTFDGKPIERFLYLPFVRDAGIINLSGSRYVISPTMVDRVISIGADYVFVRLRRARPTFRRLKKFGYFANGQHQEATIIWSKIHNKTSKNQDDNPYVRAETTMGHYLFCKYGFSEAFQRFAGCTPVVGTAEEINQRNYPLNEWTICTSSLTKFNVPLRVAVRNEDFKSAMVKNMIGNFFYVIEHFVSSRNFEAYYVEHTRWWRILLGLMLPGSGDCNEGKIAEEMDQHIRSLDEYIDETTRMNFLEIGHEVNDLYQMFALVMEKFRPWIMSASSKINSMYDKELSVCYYVLNEIASNINTFYFRLMKAVEKAEKDKKPLTADGVINIMKKTIKPRLIYKITKGHGELSTVSAPGDNMAFKMTSLLVPQTSSNKQGGRKDNVAIDDPAFGLHVSVAEYGGYTHIPKTEPSGRSRLNHYAMVSPSGVMLRNPALKELLDRTQVKLNAKGRRQHAPLSTHEETFEEDN